MAWFSVRCVFHWNSVNSFEERVTLWQADSAEAAISSAEREAREYEETSDSDVSIHYVGLAQAYELVDSPHDGAEVFSLLRDSLMTPDEYINHFFDTGNERQGAVD